jgi:hypothetical protein
MILNHCITKHIDLDIPNCFNVFMLTPKDIKDLRKIFHKAFIPFNTKMMLIERKVDKILKVLTMKK